GSREADEVGAVEVGLDSESRPRGEGRTNAVPRRRRLPADEERPTALKVELALPIRGRRDLGRFGILLARLEEPSRVERALRIRLEARRVLREQPCRRHEERAQKREGETAQETGAGGGGVHVYLSPSGTLTC